MRNISHNIEHILFRDIERAIQLFQKFWWKGPGLSEARTHSDHPSFYDTDYLVEQRWELSAANSFVFRRLHGLGLKKPLRDVHLRQRFHVSVFESQVPQRNFLQGRITRKFPRAFNVRHSSNLVSKVHLVGVDAVRDLSYITSPISMADPLRAADITNGPGTRISVA